MKHSEGQCRCGAIRFRVAGVPLVTMACHCTGCQRMTASAYSLSSLYPVEAFELTAGEPVLGGLRGATEHLFCPSCMSWLFTRPEGLKGFINVRSSLLDDANAHAPFVETFTSEKLAFAATGATHSFATFPPSEAFPELLTGYKARRVTGGAEADLM